MKRLKIILSILGTIIMMYVMNITGRQLITQTTPNGILNLEFAYNQQRIDVILNAWMPSENINRLEIAKINTYWDFLYLFFYGFLLYNICNLLKHKLINGFGTIGVYFGKLAIIASLLDVVENGFMLSVLDSHYNPITLYIMVIASVLKWVIIAIVILYSSIGLVRLAGKAIFRN